MGRFLYFILTFLIGYFETAQAQNEVVLGKFMIALHKFLYLLHSARLLPRTFLFPTLLIMFVESKQVGAPVPPLP